MENVKDGHEHQSIQFMVIDGIKHNLPQNSIPNRGYTLFLYNYKFLNDISTFIFS